MNEMALPFGAALPRFFWVICCLILLVAESFASADATKGLSDRPLETFGAVTPMLLGFFCGRRFRSCGSDRGLSDRPLDPFGADSPMLLLEYSYSGKFGCPFLYRMCKGCVEVTCCVP